MITSRIVLTGEAIDTMASQAYSQYSSEDPLGIFPTFDELPERLKRRWREIGRLWLKSIVDKLSIVQEDVVPQVNIPTG